MKRTIRNGMFETNSSSTHSLIIATAEEFDLWNQGQLIYDDNTCKFITEDECINQKLESAGRFYECKYKNDPYHLKWENLDEDLKKQFASEYDDDWRYITVKKWDDEEYLEFYEERYTSPSGDELVIFGKYGNDY